MQRLSKSYLTWSTSCWTEQQEGVVRSTTRRFSYLFGYFIYSAIFMFDGTILNQFSQRSLQKYCFNQNANKIQSKINCKVFKFLFSHDLHARRATDHQEDRGECFAPLVCLHQHRTHEEYDTFASRQTQPKGVAHSADGHPIMPYICAYRTTCGEPSTWFTHGQVVKHNNCQHEARIYTFLEFPKFIS